MPVRFVCDLVCSCMKSCLAGEHHCGGSLVGLMLWSRSILRYSQGPQPEGSRCGCREYWRTGLSTMTEDGDVTKRKPKDTTPYLPYPRQGRLIQLKCVRDAPKSASCSITRSVSHSAYISKMRRRPVWRGLGLPQPGCIAGESTVSLGTHARGSNIIGRNRDGKSRDATPLFQHYFLLVRQPMCLGFGRI